MTTEDGMTVINTTTLCSKVKGYNENTPVKIYIKDGKIVKVEPLRNKETPKFWARVKKGMINSWDRMNVKKAAKAKVDVVTGATLSSNALIKNVQEGIKYYQSNNNKKK